MASSMPAAVVKPAAIESELKITDVADALQVCTKTVRRLIASGELEARRYGYRTLRIPTSSVEAFRARHTIATVKRDWSQVPNRPGVPQHHLTEWADPTGNKAAHNVEQLGGGGAA